MNTIYRYLLLISMMLLSQSLFAGSTIQFPARTYTVNEAAGQAELPVVRLNDFDTIVSVEYFTVEATASGGQDFTATSGTLTFAAGETNRAIMVPILNDGLYEALERFQVALTNVTGDAVLGMMRVATVSIQDNETPVQLEFSAYRAREDEGSVLIGLVRGGEGEALTLEYATANGTALAGEDYAAMSGTLAFEAGENLKLLTVPIFNDGLKESNETLQLYLTNAPAGMLGAAKTATITLVDNDPGVQFEFKREWVHETDGAVEVKVIRGNDGGLGPFTVDYATTAGTAQAGVHYVETAGTLSFGTGEMSRSVTVPILNDLAASADRTFQIQLGQLSGGAVPGPTQTLTVTILDMTGMQAHAFSRMQLLPDRCLELILEGGVHSRYQSFFDLYSVETSADLDLWQTWRTLECTGAAGDALRCVDSTPPGAGSRFYRMSSEPAITPIPPPTGPHPVGLITRFITDSTRRNRFGVSGNGTFSVTLFYPADAQAGARPPRFLDEGSGRIKQDPDFRESWMGFIPVEKQLIARALSEAPFARASGPCPVVLFSAGWKGWTWRQTSTKAQELASHGYVVVWVTHYDATWACLPNQRVTYQTDDQVPFTAPGLLDRVQDLRFVLEQLQQWNQVGGEFTGCFDLEAVAAIGFSWGIFENLSG